MKSSSTILTANVQHLGAENHGAGAGVWQEGPTQPETLWRKRRRERAFFISTLVEVPTSHGFRTAEELSDSWVGSRSGTNGHFRGVLDSSFTTIWPSHIDITDRTPTQVPRLSIVHLLSSSPSS